MNQPRIKSLDGLRGVAALIVVVSHAVLCIPSLSAALVIGDADDAMSSAARWLTFSPLRMFWAGGECVLIFFVLSGYVLSRAVPRALPDWSAYVPRRMIRLYVPTFVAVVVAAAFIIALPRHIDAGASYWLRERPTTVEWHDAARDVLLVVDAPGHLSSVLWSLQWEVLFSLLLPVLIVVVRRARHLGPVAAVCAALIAVSTELDSAALQYLPVFLFGVLLAESQARRAGAWEIAGARRLVLWPVTFGLLLVRWLPGPRLIAFTNRNPEWNGSITLLNSVGATLLIVLILTGSRAGRFLSSRVPAWLGSRSFSLYLIHEPIVIAVVVLLQPQGVWFAASVIAGVALSLIGGECFYRLVEARSLRWAQHYR